MDVIYGIDKYKSEKHTAVTVGKFDGIHTGHALLTNLITDKKLRLKSVIVSFEESPRNKLFDPEAKHLVTEKERIYIMKKAGVDAFLLLPFDDQMMHMSPENFIEMLVKNLHMKYMAVGSDFTYGYMGAGDARLLKELSDKFRFRLDVIEKLKADNQDVSSSRIRDLISMGEIQEANRLLGYPYFIFGQIIHGNHIGTRMGTPTINLAPPDDKLLPPNGVYVTKVIIDGRMYHGVTDVGRKPTIDIPTKNTVVETHLLDYSDNLYEKEADVQFLKYLRPEKKFESLSALQAQIRQDAKTAREFFDSGI